MQISTKKCHLTKRFNLPFIICLKGFLKAKIGTGLYFLNRQLSPDALFMAPAHPGERENNRFVKLKPQESAGDRTTKTEISTGPERPSKNIYLQRAEYYNMDISWISLFQEYFIPICGHFKFSF